MTTSQYFVYKRPIAWTLLVFTMIWGVVAYRSMPQRQDPQIQVRSGVIQTSYPGANAIEVEQEVTRKIEKKMSENPAVEHVRSLSRQGLSVVFVDLYDTTKNAEPVWQDLDNKLASMTDLPTVGNEPLKPKLDKDFGDTVALMLTLSSPQVSEFEVERRAELIAQTIKHARAARPVDPAKPRFSAVLVHPSTLSPAFVERAGRSLLERLSERGLIEDGQFLAMLGAGAVDFQLARGCDEPMLRRETERWTEDYLGAGIGHPDVWPGVIVKDPDSLASELNRVCREEPGGIARYSYEDLRGFADLVRDRLRQSTRVGKIELIGTLDETVYLYYSNRRLGALGLDPAALAGQLAFRNINLPGGTVELKRQSLVVKPGGKLLREGEIGDQVFETRGGFPAYLRDLVEVVRGYEDPPSLLNFRTKKAHRAQDRDAHTGPPEPTGIAHETEKAITTRAITLAVRHVKGTQIADFSRDVDATLKALEGVLPDDLRLERTSNEPALVTHKIDQFLDCFLEAVIIVVVVALLFMEWRSALLVAMSIPITVAMTLGICAMLGIDLQQISIAALIIALGLLVDDPVVAGDAINREIAHGVPRPVAAWLGPQKLSRAILFATVTNCVAFLPLLLVTGIVGEFIYSLPVVVTASLVASRLVSMTFIPLLGSYLLRGQLGMEAGIADDGKSSRFARMYNGFSEWCMEHKSAALACCLVVLGGALSLLPLIGTNFFPKDLHNVLTVNMFLAEGTPIRQTKAEAMKTIEGIEGLIGPEVDAYTTFVGAGGPRFWLSIVPEQPAANYAQILVHTRNSRQTESLALKLKRELPALVPSARMVVQQIETGPPIGVPVQVRLQGQDLQTLERLGDQIKRFMREFPGSTDIQDDWDPQILQLALQVDADRANLAGITHQDVASLMGGGLGGTVTTRIRQRDRLIPVTLKLRPDERSRVEDLMTLEARGAQSGHQVPLDQVSAFRTEMVRPKIARRDNERCLTVKCDTVTGVLPSRLVEFLDAKLHDASKSWPPGYRFAFGGEKEEQAKGFGSMSIAMVASVLAIYLALVLQFNSLTKPLVVFAAVPFGMVGGLMGLLIFDVPVGFFALLGLSSLAGVIISHVIILFEYIEEAHQRGEPLRRAVIDAGLVRLRPVLVTVLATVGGLIPLVIKGGPLWEPLCYVQIVGLLCATLVTKVVVPVLYVLFVEDFKIIKWSAPGEIDQDQPPAEFAHAADRVKMAVN